MVVDASLSQGNGIVALDDILRNGFIAHIFMSGDQLAHESLHPRAVSIRKPFIEADVIRAIQEATTMALSLP